MVASRTSPREVWASSCSLNRVCEARRVVWDGPSQAANGALGRGGREVSRVVATRAGAGAARRPPPAGARRPGGATRVPDWIRFRTSRSATESVSRLESPPMRMSVSTWSARSTPARPHAAHASTRASGPELGGARLECLARERAVDGVELVAEGSARERLPAIVARERGDLVAEPLELEPGAEAVVDGGDLLERRAGRAGHLDDVERREHGAEPGHACGAAPPARRAWTYCGQRSARARRGRRRGGGRRGSRRAAPPPGAKYSISAAMSSGRGRLRTSQRVARSTSFRPSSSRSSWTSAAMDESSSSIDVQSVRRSKTSRATMYARAMSAARRPSPRRAGRRT